MSFNIFAPGGLMRFGNRLAVAVLIALFIAATAAFFDPATHAAQDMAAPKSASLPGNVKVTILSTMLVGESDKGIGEWGFAAVLEVDGKKLLIDTGMRPETVLHN